MCLKGDNLLLLYSNEHARLWDARTREFRRALLADKAEEILLEEGWIQMYLYFSRVRTEKADYFQTTDNGAVSPE